MSLTIEEVTAISRRVAADLDANLTVSAVASNDSEAGRLELLITLEGCHREPCQVMVNVPRLERQGLEQALRRELTDILRQHRDA